jgi:CRISPR-associated protein Cas5d
MSEGDAHVKHSKVFEVRAKGEIACFTRPEMKVERMSYEVMTPSAARGVLEAILWKPAIRWVIDEIRVGAPVQWLSFRRNEVKHFVSTNAGHYFADERENRTQRNTVALRDVDYLIRAHFLLTEQAGDEENITKFEEMFHRRLQKGQHFHQPYLGCREFAAQVSPSAEGFRSIDPAVSRPLGLMFYDYDFRASSPRPLFFDARLESGVLKVPSIQSVLRENGASS